MERCRLKAASRSAPTATDGLLSYGIPLLLDQIIAALQAESSGPQGDARAALSNGAAGTRRLAHELVQQVYTIDRVVHEYGDLCQAITDLASEEHEAILAVEFRTLHRCLDNAIAESVAEFSSERDVLVAARGSDTQEHLGAFAHELRNLIVSAMQAVKIIGTGHVGLSGPTGAVLDRSLRRLRDLVEWCLADVRLGSAVPAKGRLCRLVELIAEIELFAKFEAQAHECAFTVAAVDPHLAVEVDRDMLLSALGNVLQNAFKFTLPKTEVSLNVHTNEDRILIDVEDHCGGLPPGDAEYLFRPFTQSGVDKSGVGLGLCICRRNVEANKGTISVRNLPGAGCVFTIALPRHVADETFCRV
jgi:K+-sensing histidine kinase KdpD